jgi:hypothetical protein
LSPAVLQLAIARQKEIQLSMSQVIEQLGRDWQSPTTAVNK